MIKCIIIDDEPLARAIVTEYLLEHKNIAIVAECDNGFEGLKAINEHQPDLLFLDIQMPKINGFELLELLDEPPTIIFTTAFDEYALKAFENNAIDYLLKPFSKERFNQAIEKASLNSNKKHKIILEKPTEEAQNRIVVKHNNQIKIIPLNEVLYIESYDDYVKINTIENTFVKKKTMLYYQSVLNQNQFVRIHRSYLLNIKFLNKLEPYEKDGYLAVLTNKTKLNVSKSGYQKLKLVLGL